MGTKTIGVREAVYERLRARKREGESFTDVIDRLIDESRGDWRDGFGSLSADEADDLREAAAESRKRTASGMTERTCRAADRLDGAGGDDSATAAENDAADGTDDATDATDDTADDAVTKRNESGGDSSA